MASFLSGEPGEATGPTGARAGDVPVGSLGAQAPSLAQGVPMPSLDPRRTPASCDKQPSASMGLGPLWPGCEQLASVVANPQTPPARPPHCEDPPVLPSIRGTLTHLADPAEAEVALQDEVKLLLDAKGGDVTAEPQAVSNGTVLGTKK